MSNYLLDAVQVGNYSSGRRVVIGKVLCDTAADLPGINDFANMTLAMGSSAKDISNGDDYLMDSGGTWRLQPSPMTTQLDLSGYYTSAETDTAIATALNTEMTTVFDLRYLRIGTGTAVPDGTDFNSLTVGKFRSTNNNNGCTNMPSEASGRPFIVLVENMYGTQRLKQTLWLGQSGFTDRFYWRIQTSNNSWTGVDWYKVTGTVAT